MSRKSTIARHTLSEIEAQRERGEDPTRSDAPEAESLGEDFWKSARVVMPSGKTQFICASTAMWSNGSSRAAKATSPA